MPKIGKQILLIIFLFLLTPIKKTQQQASIVWKPDNWANACDFKGLDLSNVQVKSELCGPKCVQTPGCTHFTWTTLNGGTCWMKYGPVSRADAFYTNDKSMVCGLVTVTTTAKPASSTTKPTSTTTKPTSTTKPSTTSTTTKPTTRLETSTAAIKTPSLIKNCTEVYNISSGDTCFSIQIKARLDSKRFFKLNPYLNCSNLKINDPICLNDGNFGCLNYYKLDPIKDTSCDMLAQKFSISLYTLKAINEGLDCSKPLSSIQFICTEATNPKCLSTYTVVQYDTVNKIISSLKLNENEFYAANPNIDINLIYPTQLLCIKKQDFYVKLNLTSPSINQLVQNLHSTEKNLSSLFNSLMANPNKDYATTYQEAIVNSLKTNPSVKKIYLAFESSSEGKQMLKNQGLDNLCSLIDPTLYPKSYKCACDKIEPITFCTIVFNEEYFQKSKTVNKKIQNEKNQRIQGLGIHHSSRFAVCTLDQGDLSKLFGIQYTWDLNNNQRIQGCLKGDCCYMDIVCLGGNVCDSVSSTDDKAVQYGLRISLFVKFCVPAVREALEAAQLKKFWDGCFMNININYYPIRGTVGGGITFDVAILRLNLAADVQMYRPYPRCDGSCANNYGGNVFCYANPGNIYGSFNIQLGINFGFISFWKTVYEKNLDPPQCSTPPEPLPPPKICNKKIVGYYTSWGKKELSLEVAKAYTHIIYAFMEMKSNGEVVVGVPDVTNNYNSDSAYSLKRLNSLMDIKKSLGNNVKVLFSVGGWANSQYFSSMVNNNAMFANFVNSIKNLISKYSFDGVDLDWEYPVTGGATQGVKSDKDKYVNLISYLRKQLGSDKLLTITGAAGNWVLDVGFDLANIINNVDWINVMAYDYFGPWDSMWGAFTGSNSPLYFSAPKGFSGKLNVDYTLKYYSCYTGRPDKLVMGVGFYGHRWENVDKTPIDGKDGMWRKASPGPDGKFVGGPVSFDELTKTYLLDASYKYTFHAGSQTPYLYSESKNSFISFDNKESIQAKVNYAQKNNLGGIMVWSIDDDDASLTLTNTVSAYCGVKTDSTVTYKCSPLKQGQRCWWIPEDGIPANNGRCGSTAPLYNGKKPLCDPDDPSYNCCGPFGYCGSGAEYCDCPTCVNYSKNIDLLLSCV